MQPANYPDKNAQAHIDGQAPARRIGYLIAFVVILCGCLSLTGVWYVFNKDDVEVLQTSFQLQSSGVTTTGTVAAVEQFSGVRPESSSSFKFIVEYVVDGETYSIQSNTYYPTRSSSWVGETMPIIYDPENPRTAQIDTFKERWGYAFLSVLP
jgi:hypothetical protein